VAALEKMLKDSPVEKAARMKRAFKFCKKRTFTGWVDNFLKELKMVCQPHSVDDPKFMFMGLAAA
jgi:trehalose-6-phosphate synthase